MHVLKAGLDLIGKNHAVYVLRPVFLALPGKQRNKHHNTEYRAEADQYELVDFHIFHLNSPYARIVWPPVPVRFWRTRQRIHSLSFFYTSSFTTSSLFCRIVSRSRIPRSFSPYWAVPLKCSSRVASSCDGRGRISSGCR